MSDTGTLQEVTLRIIYPGVFLIADAKINVYLDGQSLGIGWAKKGINIEVKTKTGKHRLTLQFLGGFRKKEYSIDLHPGAIYEAHLMYDRTKGNFTNELQMQEVSAAMIEFPYGCPECAVKNFDKVKAHQFVPIPIKGVSPFAYSCPKCGTDWSVQSYSFWRRNFLFYTVGDCPHCGTHLSLYKSPGAGEEPIERVYCMRCGFYERN